MRLLLVGLLALGVSGTGLRQKRTLGIIFRGLVDATARQTTPPPRKEPNRVEKLRAPPPATVYLIPVPERDKKSDVQVFSPSPPTTTRAVTEKKNITDAKQFLIRIVNEEGKSFMLRITGEDVQVKKKGEGYTIGVSNKEAKANINIELPGKIPTTKSDVVRANLVENTQAPMYSGYPLTNPAKYGPLAKGVETSGKQVHYPYPQIPAYPYPVFLPSHYFQPLSYENHLQSQQYPTTLEKPHEPQKLYVTPTMSSSEKLTKTASEPTKPSHLQLTVSVKGSPDMKQTVAEVGKTMPKPTVPPSPAPAPVPEGYQYSDPRYLEQPFYPSPPPYQEPNPPRYQWYQPQEQVPRPIDGGQPAPQEQEGNWNFAHYTPYPAYLRDTLAPPYLPTGYGRAARRVRSLTSS